MTLNLFFSLDNSSFDDPYRPEELREVLRKVADQLADLDLESNESGIIRDTNGNGIGQWSVD
jgi:hypothetical protein